MKIRTRIARWLMAGTRETWYPIISTPTPFGPITATRALQLTAVMRCVKVLAETVSSLPLIVYRRLPNGGKERATDHPLWRVLHNQPNRWQTSLELREMLQGHMALRGNAYCEIIPTPLEEVDELIPLNPDHMKVERVESGALRYVYRDKSSVTERRIMQDRMLHLRGFSGDGVVGLSNIDYAAEAVGVSLAAQRMASSFFANDLVLGSVLEHPNQLSEPARRNLERSLQERHGGPDRAFSNLILEEGMKWQRLGVTPDQGQFLETRKFQIGDIARVFGVPPHLIGDLEKATYSNIEQQSLEFVIYTIRSWLVRWEQAIWRDLIPEDQKGEYFVEHLVDGLLRGDSKSRSEALKTQFMHGAISQDEWREIENRNPLPNGEGKRFYVPLNLVRTEDAATGKVDGRSRPGGQEPEGNSMEAFDVVVCDAAERISKAECREMERKLGWARSTPGKLHSWAKQFYGEQREYVSKVLMPVAAVYEATTGRRVNVVTLTKLTNSLTTGRLEAILNADLTHEWQRVKPTVESVKAAIYLHIAGRPQDAIPERACV